jgi:hypothetical protein
VETSKIGTESLVNPRSDCKDTSQIKKEECAINRLGQFQRTVLSSASFMVHPIDKTEGTLLRRNKLLDLQNLAFIPLVLLQCLRFIIVVS